MEDPRKKEKKQFNKYVRFSSVAMQMGGTVAGMALLGSWLDEKYNPEGTAFTLSLTLFGVVASMYLVIREVINLSKDDKD